MKLFYLILLFTITLYAQNPCPGIPTVIYAGKTYNTVQIGGQCWFKENLDIGTEIIGKSEQTNNNIIEKYCYNDVPANCTMYGGLYQWAEAVQYKNGTTNTTYPHPGFTGNIQGICPTSWHIPSDSEITILTTFVGGNGNALKAVGQGTPPGAGINTSGFSGLLAGCRYNGNFYALATVSFIWSATAPDSVTAYQLYLYFNAVDILSFDESKAYGKNVRCLMDNIAGINDNNKSGLPKEFLLLQNYPNPFNPSTSIRFSLPYNSNVKLNIYNAIGENVSQVFSGVQPAGVHEINFNGSSLPSGVYFCSITANSIDGKINFTSIKKMILLK